ncbi:MAG: hypothetical protein J0H63_06185 [Rhizobiales bacterium]|nr:hypothetical protein [Hyphomicrobiales bacterium]
MRSRNSRSTAVSAAKYWRAAMRPWTTKAVSTMSPPSSLAPKGMVLPVTAFSQWGQAP